MADRLATIAYFAFRRPHHTRRSLESLAVNALARDSRLFIYIDGPRDERDEELVAEVEEVARSEQWCGFVEVVRRARNVGCAASTIEVMSDLTDRFDRVICLEDDNLLSPFFLDFVNQAFTRFSNEDRVMEVTGYRYPLSATPAVSGFLGATVGWGWGTWRRAWRHFNPDGQYLLRCLSNDKRVMNRFEMGGAASNLEMLRAQIAGKIGGWDVRWAASVALRNGLTLYPAHALSANIGHDGSGTNCNATDFFQTTLANDLVDDFPFSISENAEFRNALRKYFIAEHGGAVRHSLRKAKHFLLRRYG